MAELRLASGHIALVDDEDLPAVLAAGPWRVHRNDRGRYVRSRDLSRLLHQFLTGWPMTDHANGDGLDNRRVNLRPANHSQNAANSRMPKTNTSGFKGVHWRKDRKRWTAAIRRDYRRIHLGYFDTPEAAASAYDAAAIAAWGEFARTNFPRVAA